MPMPTGGAWPPANITPAYQAYTDWDAWYAGDADQLHRVYVNRNSSGGTLSPNQRVRAGQYAGGVVGAFSRWVWGSPPPLRSRDSRLHVPLASDLAAAAAGLLFSEPVALVTKDKAAQQRIAELAEAGLNTMFRHAAETGSAMGDVYLRPVIDRDVSPNAAIADYVHADGAIPVIRWGHLVEVTFWSLLATDNASVCMRLLEHHEKGRITYALHRGDALNLGRQVPLAEHPTAAALIVDENSGQDTGLPDRLAVVRVPNAGPQRRWRKTAGLKYLGRSDFDGNEPIFDRCDGVWTSWMQDIQIARGRITVPAYMLQNNGTGDGATWDPDREVYIGLNQMPNATGNSQLTATQFEIRHVEHKATIDALVEVAMRHAGLSAQTLGEEGDVAMTATEAQSRERLSFVTRGDRIATWTPGIAEYVELHMAIERAAGMSTVAPVRPTVEFSDGVTESPLDTARTVQMLRAAEVISIETGVAMVHPDWEPEQVTAEVKKIRDDQAQAGAGMDAIGALAGYSNGNGPDQDGPPEE